MKAPAGSKAPGKAPESAPEKPAAPKPVAKAKPMATARKSEGKAEPKPADARPAPAAQAAKPEPAVKAAQAPAEAKPAAKAPALKAAAARASNPAKVEAAPRAEPDDAETSPPPSRATARPAAPPGTAEAQAPAPSMTSSNQSEPVIQAPIRPAPPPKPLGNAGKDFKAGDHVVYPTHGVGQVQGIEEVPVAGLTLKVIVVTFEENRMTLKVPMAKAASSGLRKLASDKVMGEAMDTLKGRARIKRTMWSRRAQEYEQKINSGDPIAIAEVVRDLHRNAGQPDQSFSERQIYELALDRLAAEVAAMDRTDKAAATQKLLDHLKTAEKAEKAEKPEKEK
ncbi:CarD family transcriptional regulator [Roseomonas populi]|uniref:CarD family transcriptional regulator n=1 Tax=Roseomonas populi TaxID=3121582 RepID=A0ABT1X5V9_9PROT|nr:CarD family transcriptional regulator [Roseomonas pecuniae]MCR0983486.1 CarD family transcriptional regulator [Roseomonas pecuniae]